MANKYVAQINSSNEVVKVLVAPDVENPENYIANLVNDNSFTFKECKKDGSIRQRMAGIGSTYNAEQDVFISPSPYEGWTLDANNEWQCPIAYPTDTTFDPPISLEVDGVTKEFINKPIYWNPQENAWMYYDNNDNLFKWNSTDLVWEAFN